MSLINSSIRRVACAISGGVDSAVAALLLQRKGFDVIGVFMKNWDAQDEMGTCLSSWDDFEDAQAICESLGIELVQVSFVKEYWNDVFSSLLEDYENGMTPNPDIFCNRFIKFGALYSHAMEKIGVEAIATGHYARTSFGTFLENYRSDKNVNLLRAVDPIKDQTLFLSQVHQEALRRTMFPLGNLYKHQVRKIALENNMLKVSKKPDSTGICFIGKRNFKDFISEYIPNHRGPFVDVDTGDTVAYHNGVHHYTVGERCRISRQKTKYFVVRRDPSTQAILVASSVDHPSIYTDCVFTKVPHWISDPPRLSSSHPFYCLFRFQHSDRSIPCQIFEGCDGLRILLGAPMRAITPGQGKSAWGAQKLRMLAGKILSKHREENILTGKSHGQDELLPSQGQHPLRFSSGSHNILRETCLLPAIYKLSVLLVRPTWPASTCYATCLRKLSTMMVLHI